MSRYRSDEEKWSCVALHKYAGWPNIQIQNALGLPHSTVSDILKKYDTIGTVQNQFGNSGRKPCKASLEVLEEMMCMIMEEQNITGKLSLKG